MISLINLATERALILKNEASLHALSEVSLVRRNPQVEPWMLDWVFNGSGQSTTESRNRT